MTFCITTLMNNTSISEDIINLQSSSSAPQHPGQHTSLFECHCEVMATLIALLITVFHLQKGHANALREHHGSPAERPFCAWQVVKH